jgi:hypothetical protein
MSVKMIVQTTKGMLANARIDQRQYGCETIFDQFEGMT